MRTVEEVKPQELILTSRRGTGALRAQRRLDAAFSQETPSTGIQPGGNRGQDHLAENGEVIVVTDLGRPIARIVKPEAEDFPGPKS